MKYEGIIIRPPSEADSLILQVTTGCSHNRCTFCPTYKGQRFRIKTLSEIDEDLHEAACHRPIRRVFLCDGDALVIPQARLLEILASVHTYGPDLERIATYANAKSILGKSTEDLAVLRDMGLRMIYMGIETGNDELLRTIRKGTTSAKLIEAGKRIRNAGMTLSVTILLGIGGVERSIQHAMDTAEVLTEIDPDFVGALTLMIVPGTPLHEDYIHGQFVLPDTFSFLRELLLIVRNASFTDCLFTSNHASNYLPIRVRLPSERLKAIQMIENVLLCQDGTMLRPEAYRAL